MPTYEYECAHCGHRFEVLQKITDKPLEACPKCNKRVKRLIGSGTGIIFKGSGFYTTDYRKKDKGKKAQTQGTTCPRAKEGCRTCPQAQ